MEEAFRKEFIANALYRMDESTRMIQLSLEQLDESDIWRRTSANTNSVGNLILHLCGNIGQYAISSLGETEDIRERDSEFLATDGRTKADLLEKLVNTVNKAKTIIAQSNSETLLKHREVQGFNFSGIGVVIHVVEHYSYHTGQIAFWTKQLKDKDLGFYKDVDLNTKNN